jgi:tetratricopeptide (TPR) repeat protein
MAEIAEPLSRRNTEMLNNHLSTLENAELIRVAQIEPELEYLFRHAMVQDAAYDSLLRLDRKRLHHAVGHALERLYPERRKEIAAELARHFEHGDDPSHALEYYRLAADHNADQYALPEAIELYCRAIDLARQVARDQTDLLCHLFLKRGRSSELLSDYYTAMEGYEDMESLAVQTGNQVLLLSALMAKALLYATGNPLHNVDQAMAVGERSLSMARASGDRAAEARSLWILSLAHYYGRSDLVTASEIGEEALALAREVGAAEQIAFTLGDLASIYSISGKLPEARAYVAETIDLWYAENNLPMVATNLITAARLAGMAGELAEALRLSDDAQLIAETVGNMEGVILALVEKVTNHTVRGEIGAAMAAHDRIHVEGGPFSALVLSWMSFLLHIYAELGLVKKLRDASQKLIDPRLLDTLIPGAASQILASWVRAEAAIGEPGQGTAILEQSLASAELAPFDRFPLLEIYLVRGEFDHALAGSEEYLESIWWLGHRVYLWDGLRVKARALIALNRLEEAWGVLHMAREDAEDMEAKLYLWQIHALLAEVEAKLGHTSEAEEERESALDFAQDIADSIDDPALRRAFMENTVNAKEDF